MGTKLIWASLSLFAVTVVLLIARTTLCVSGGYFSSINTSCFATINAGFFLVLLAALLLAVIGCVIKALNGEKL